MKPDTLRDGIQDAESKMRRAQQMRTLVDGAPGSDDHIQSNGRRVSLVSLPEGVLEGVRQALLDAAEQLEAEVRSDLREMLGCAEAIEDGS